MKDKFKMTRFDMEDVVSKKSWGVVPANQKLEVPKAVRRFWLQIRPDAQPGIATTVVV